MRALNKTLLFFGIIFTSCALGTPITTQEPSNNKTYQVDYLFEHDGCKVYRFYDHNYYVYFTNCNGETTSVRTDSTKTRVTNVIRNSSGK